MSKVRYDGPGHTLHAFGKIIRRGKSDEFTDSEIRSLLAQPHIHITIEPGAPTFDTARPSLNGSRRQWAGYAATFGIDTEGMSRDDIVAAVDALQNDSASAPADDDEPEAAHVGEGHHNHEQQEE